MSVANLNLFEHLWRQKAFSLKTFGPAHDRSWEGVIDHIQKELREIASEHVAGCPSREALLEEWIDVAILTFDGALREGFSPAEIVAALLAKQIKNEGRKWPDWRAATPGKAIEHIREGA